MNRMVLDEIINLVNREIGPTGYECLEVEWVGSERILRVFIDHPAGIKMEDCVTVTRMLQDLEALDERVSGSFNLEISSPGVERPLRTHSHFERHIGERVKISLTEKIGERKHGSGKVVSVTGDDVVLETDEGTWVFPLRALKKANLVYDWDHG